MHGFEDAKYLPLKTDADFAKFVDPGVGGADRELAIHLLELMPPGMRGDFVYIRGDGSVFSNRPELASKVIFTPAVSGRAGKSSTVRVAESSRRRTMSYPPTGGSGGAYIRYYSQQGINAASGYATVPCDGNFPEGVLNEGGDMYFNAYSATSGGSVVDAGLETNATTTTAPGLTTAQTVSAFVNDPSAGANYWDPGTWHNQSQVWGCDQPIGIIYGTYEPNSASQPISLIGTGIPDYDPRQMWLPPASTTWSSTAWMFFPTPSALVDYANGTWNGIPTPCMGCSVARMFTIAQSNPSNDGACFGGCTGGTATGEWDEVVGGELVSPCDQTSPDHAECSIEYLSSGSWISGENDSGYGIFTGNQNDQQGLDGIDLSSGMSPQKTLISTSGKFKDPLPTAPAYACSPDSDQYCAATMSQTNNECVRYMGGPGGTYYPVPLTTTTYDIFKKFSMLELQGTYTYTMQSTPGTGPYPNTSGYPYCGTITTNWSPANPGAVYNDPNLP